MITKASWAAAEAAVAAVEVASGGQGEEGRGRGGRRVAPSRWRWRAVAALWCNGCSKGGGADAQVCIVLGHGQVELEALLASLAQHNVLLIDHIRHRVAGGGRSRVERGDRQSRSAMVEREETTSKGCGEVARRR